MTDVTAPTNHIRNADGIRRRRTGAALTAVALTLLAAGADHALAQTASGQGGATVAQTQSAEQVHDFSIPPQPLASAFDALSDVTGLSFFYTTSDLDGVVSPGVSGTMSLRDALARLLAGTGMTARFTSETAVAIEKPQASGNADTVRLDPIQIEAQGQGATTEDTGSYTTGTMGTATKLPLSMRETPQTVTVYTRQRMDDEGLTEARDAIENTPGIAITATAPYRETYYSRGFAIENYMFDGLTVTSNSSRRGTFLNDLAMYDRVEVMRGAAGLTQGVGTPSAALNFVRKRPTADTRVELQGEVGSWNAYAAQADVSSPVVESGKVRARSVARYHESDSFQDVVEEERKLFYLIGEADVTESTLLTASVAHQDNDNTTTYGGLPTAKDGSDLGLPRSTYLGNDWNYWNDTTTEFYANLKQELPADWTMDASFLQIWGTQEQLRAGVTLNADDTWDQTGGRGNYDNDRTSYDLNFSGPVTVFERKHDIVFGASRRVADEKNDTAGYWPLLTWAYDIDIYNWNHDAPEPSSYFEDYHRTTKETQQGVYATTRIDLADPLDVILGARVDWYEFDATDEIYDAGSGTWSTYQSGYHYDSHLTKYAGVVYDLDSRHSVYASYTDIFEPQNAVDASNAFLKPIVGTNYEIGVKGEYFDGALNASAALFRIDQENLAMADGPCPFNPSSTCYRAAGEVRSEGVELEVQGALSENWQMAAGYTYVTTEVIEDSDPDAIGDRLNTHLPRHQFKLSSVYRFLDNQWRVGGNMRWQSDIFHDNDWAGYAYHTEQDAYAVVDLMLGYSPVENLDVQFRVNNVFDEKYYSAINAQPVTWGGNTVYGPPREFRLVAKYRF